MAEASQRSEPAPISLTALKDIGLRAARQWSARNASSKGAALALYTLFSLAPILLLVTAVAGLFFTESTVRSQLVEQVRVLVGDQGAAAVVTLLNATQKKSTNLMAAAISFGIVLVSATTAFAELKSSLDDLWQLPPSHGNSFWIMARERFVSLGLLLVLVLLLLFSLVISALVAALQALWGSYWQHQVLAETVALGSALVAFIIIVALFASIYKLLPNTPIAWRDVMPGALFTAMLFTVGKAGIGFYLGHGGVSSAYGAAGSFVALILWVYYSAQIFFYGALLTHEWTFTLGSRRFGPRQVAHVDYIEVANTTSAAAVAVAGVTTDSAKTDSVPVSGA